VCCVSFDRGVISCDVCYLFVVSNCITTMLHVPYDSRRVIITYES
jgi:hypothetical protein